MPSILFWNYEQAKAIHSDHPRLIITGDYGTGKTIVLEAKLRALLAEGFKCMFISCLLPTADGVTPIYEVLMRERLHGMGGNCKFLSAQEICRAMGDEVSENIFYSVLVDFIENLTEEFVIFFDEFGDGFASEEDSNSDLLSGVAESLAQSDTKQLIISQHPRCNISLEIQKYEYIKLCYIMRNTASIFDYDRLLLQTKTLALATTVCGIPPVFIPNNGDDFYQRAVNEVSTTSKKFVCLLLDDDDDVRYRCCYEMLKNELDKKGIESFEYLKDEDKEMMKSFMRSTKGCLITRYKHVRGTESTTLLYFTKDMNTERVDNCSKMLRGTTNLVVAQLAKGTPLKVEDFSLGGSLYFFVQGSYADHSVYKSVADIMVKIEVDDFLILRTDNSSVTRIGAVMLLTELQRREFDTHNNAFLPSNNFKILEGLDNIQIEKILVNGGTLITVHWETNEDYNDIQQIQCRVLKAKSDFIRSKRLRILDII